jgi:uncharacterized protein
MLSQNRPFHYVCQLPADQGPSAMLMVKTCLGPSAIEGLGLFAGEDIPKGTVTWRFVPGFDQTFSPEEIERLPLAARDELSRYTYLHTRTGKYVACLDNARFMNHSDSPNTMGAYYGPDDEGFDVATRDIAKGEELTCDYTLFDAETQIKLGLEPPPVRRNGKDGHGSTLHTNSATPAA